MTVPELPPEVAVALAAELVVQSAADRVEAPDPEDMVALMRLNGLHDPDDEG